MPESGDERAGVAGARCEDPFTSTARPEGDDGFTETLAPRTVAGDPRAQRVGGAQPGAERLQIGIFGGAFDPIHNGHLFVAEAVREACGLDRVIFLPTRAGAHKEKPRASTAQRAEMVRLAIASNTAFALDETDLDDAATGYTADTIPVLAARYPAASFTFIAGIDSLARSVWKRLDEVLDAVELFAVVPRADIPESALAPTLAALDAAHAAKIRLLTDTPLVAESSTLVRDRIAKGLGIRYLVPEPVWRYVRERGLYA